jgi:hypothetical protein
MFLLHQIFHTLTCPHTAHTLERRMNAAVNRYPASLQKDLTAALTAHGYIEDKGAAIVLESAGTYKRQHNTDTDLIQIHVFPRVEIIGGADGDGGDGDGGEGGADAAPQALHDERVAVVVG